MQMPPFKQGSLLQGSVTVAGAEVDGMMVMLSVVGLREVGVGVVCGHVLNSVVSVWVTSTCVV